jgi:hypothetical protein
MNTVLLAILNTLWQSAAIAAGVWLLLKLARRTNAATRHAVWWAALTMIAILPAILRRAAVIAQASATPLEFVSAPAPVQAPDLPPLHEPAPAPRKGVELPAGSWTLVVFGLWALACLVQLGRTCWSYRY